MSKYQVVGLCSSRGMFWERGCHGSQVRWVPRCSWARARGGLATRKRSLLSKSGGHREGALEDCLLGWAAVSMSYGATDPALVGA